MKVPGFRKDKRVIKKVLDRYIPPLVIVSGASVGFIAASADLIQGRRRNGNPAYSHDPVQTLRTISPKTHGRTSPGTEGLHAVESTEKHCEYKNK
ncbi:protein translocase subunit secy/sec61 alpha [Candidatus Haloredivivus sp. G17]|nr:protein translocase subunit secy/sec61 alpha [Candidatus Haloredivivus sp. G17]